MTYTIGPNNLRSIDDLVGKLAAHDVIQQARGHACESKQGINLPNGARVVSIGDAKLPPMHVKVLKPGASIYSVGVGVSDVEIHGVSGEGISDPHNGDGSVLNIMGSDVRLFDVHARGEFNLQKQAYAAAAIRLATFSSAVKCLLDGGTSISAANYPGIYGGKRGAKDKNDQPPPPSGIIIRNLSVIMDGPNVWHGIRFSYGADITLQTVRIESHTPTARNGFNLKTPGPFKGIDIVTINLPNVVGPLGEGDGCKAPDWKSQHTNDVLIQNLQVINSPYWGIDLEAGTTGVRIIGGSISAKQSGINVRGPYSGWDPSKTPDHPYGHAIVLSPLSANVRLPATGELHGVKIDAPKRIGGYQGTMKDLTN